LVFNDIISAIPENEFGRWLQFSRKLPLAPQFQPFDAFFPKLVGRRVYLELIAENRSRADIASILFKRCLDWKVNMDQKEAAEQEETIKRFVTNHLAIPDNETFKLPEEEAWLKEVQRTEIAIGNQLHAYFEGLQNKIKKALVESPHLKAKLFTGENEKMLKRHGSSEFLAIGENLLETMRYLTSKDEALDSIHDELVEWISTLQEDSQLGLLSNKYPDLVSYCLNWKEEMQLQD
jgi:hypothetical protein